MDHPDAENDCYAVLGAAEDATTDEIERLYKRLAMLRHPDHGGDLEEMKALNETYRVLGMRLSGTTTTSGATNLTSNPISNRTITPLRLPP